MLKALIALFAELAVSLGGSILSTTIDILADVISDLADGLRHLLDFTTGILEFFNGLLTLDFDRMGEGVAKVAQAIIDLVSELPEQMIELGIDIIGGFFLELGKR